MPDERLFTEYLSRIGATAPTKPDFEGLRHLQERHVLSVPFENLDYHLDDRPVHMDEEILDKVVRQRRGGGCYELNPALCYLLRSLGYEVDILPGRVHRPNGLGPAMCHLALRVRLEEDWLVDVGFGRNSRHPLLLSSRETQQDPDGEYLIADAEDGGIDIHLGGKPLYRIDQRPCRIEDFRPTLWWYRTCPDSPFLQDTFCTLRTEDGRITLRGRSVTTVFRDGRTVEELADDAAVLEAYRTRFGFTLDELPQETDPALRRTAGVQTG